ncbi:hypothetical protein Y032_0343g3055 [Ancylostoma ceylanicum]|uniref:Uncharacterized protein n=1 Tax=Ancylostoma ceylanicum TaxID=53326 RepID=A0A016RYE3_9BILA|nr:hypothetical protein Y032_0343g3055 [Ancylostoma ceylanicum]
MSVARLDTTKSVVTQSSWQLNMAEVQAKSTLNKSIAGQCLTCSTIYFNLSNYPEKWGNSSDEWILLNKMEFCPASIAGGDLNIFKKISAFQKSVTFPDRWVPVRGVPEEMLKAEGIIYQMPHPSPIGPLSQDSVEDALVFVSRRSALPLAE